MTDERKKSQNASTFNCCLELPLVLGADAALGAGEDFAAIGDKTPQNQDIFVVRFFTLPAKATKFWPTIKNSSPAAALLKSWHNKSLKRHLFRYFLWIYVLLTT